MAGLQTVQKLGPLLDLFTVDQHTWRVTEVAEALGIPRSSAHLAIGGAKLPWETYFTYGTPNELSVNEHAAKFSAPSPEAEAAEERIPDEIDTSRAVANSPV